MSTESSLVAQRRPKLITITRADGKRRDQIDAVNKYDDPYPIEFPIPTIGIARRDQARFSPKGSLRQTWFERVAPAVEQAGGNPNVSHVLMNTHVKKLRDNWGLTDEEIKESFSAFATGVTSGRYRMVGRQAWLSYFKIVNDRPFHRLVRTR